MTRNQIEYQKNEELRRSNMVGEAETKRANLARESETNRANLANELLKSQAQAEQARSNRAQESIGYMNAAEAQRAHLAQETENNRSNLAREFELNRSNVAKEEENRRSHEASEQANFLDRYTKVSENQAQRDHEMQLELQKEGAASALESQRVSSEAMKQLSGSLIQNVIPKIVETFTKTF